MKRSDLLGLRHLRRDVPNTRRPTGWLILICLLLGFLLAPWLTRLAPSLFPWPPGIPRPIP